MDEKSTSKLAPTFQASTQAMVKTTRGTIKYPWDTMLVGECFRVLPEDMKLKTLKPYAYRMGKRLGKKFKVVDWGNAYEVARQPMNDSEIAIAVPSVVGLADKPNNTKYPAGSIMDLMEKQKNGES